MSEPDVIESDDNDPRLSELLAWRQRLIASGAVAPHSFKEAHVRMVLRSGRTDADQIRMMLPDPVGEHADEMARVLSEVPGLAYQPRTDEKPFPPGEFAPFVLEEQNGSPESLVLRRGDGGALELTWPTYEAPYVAYRVVSGEEERPYSPDRAQLSGRHHSHRGGGLARSVQRGAPLPGVGERRRYANGSPCRPTEIACDGARRGPRSRDGGAG